MTESMKVFVLMTLSIGSQSEVVRKNVGVTFSLHEAEDHQNKDISNEFETFQIDANWQEGGDDQLGHSDARVHGYGA